MSRKSPGPAWTLHDSALWYTCEIAVDLITGRPPGSVPEVLAPFSPWAPDERFWASGDFLLLDHGLPVTGLTSTTAAFSLLQVESASLRPVRPRQLALPATALGAEPQRQRLFPAGR